MTQSLHQSVSHSEIPNLKQVAFPCSFNALLLSAIIQKDIWSLFESITGICLNNIDLPTIWFSHVNSLFSHVTLAAYELPTEALLTGGVYSAPALSSATAGFLFHNMLHFLDLSLAESKRACLVELSRIVAATVGSAAAIGLLPPQVPRAVPRVRSRRIGRARQARPSASPL
jgi:hypothetical protein